MASKTVTRSIVNASSLFDLEEKSRFSFSCGVKVDHRKFGKVSGASLASVGLYLVTKNTLKNCQCIKNKKATRDEKDVQVLFKHFYLINHLSTTAVYINEKTRLDHHPAVPMTLLQYALDR